MENGKKKHQHFFVEIQTWKDFFSLNIFDVFRGLKIVRFKMLFAPGTWGIIQKRLECVFKYFKKAATKPANRAWAHSSLLRYACMTYFRPPVLGWPSLSKHWCVQYTFSQNAWKHRICNSKEGRSTCRKESKGNKQIYLPFIACVNILQNRHASHACQYPGSPKAVFQTAVYGKTVFWEFRAKTVIQGLRT